MKINRASNKEMPPPSKPAHTRLHSPFFPSIKLSSHLLIGLMLSMIACSSVANAQVSITMKENALRENEYLEERTFRFYSMEVKPGMINGAQSLAIKAIAAAYDSDPDIFISLTNVFPTSANDSSYYCMKQGTDVCVLGPESFSTGDFIFIGVRCIDRCWYHLTTQYLNVTDLKDNEFLTTTFQGYGSQMLKYYVPPGANDGFTSAVKISVTTDTNYANIDIFISPTSSIYEIEEKRDSMIIARGIGMKFTSSDPNFCVQCYIYIFVDVEKAGSYQVLASASARSEQIYISQAKDVIINSKQGECFQYYVAKSTTDVMFNFQQYEGYADVYVSVSNYPMQMTDKSVVFIADYAPSRQIILSVADRASFNVLAGLYYVCAYAYEDSSFNLVVTEFDTTTKYQIQDEVSFNSRIQFNNSVQLVYTHTDLAQDCAIQVSLKSLSQSSNGDPPRIYYKLCTGTTQNSCSMTSEEMMGRSTKTTSELGGGKLYSNLLRTGFIYHNSSNCQDPNSCYYIFSAAVNITTSKSQFVLMSFYVNHTTYTLKSIQLTQSYVNVKKQGSYQFYTLYPYANKEMRFITSLVFDLVTYQGDADLFVSLSNRFPNMTDFDYRSRSIDVFDQIVLNATTKKPTLNQPIYIGVYMVKRTSYQLYVKPTFQNEYNAQLSKAEIIQEGVGVFCNFTNQYDNKFLKFNPWWTDSENRSMVFTVQNVQNNIYFYVDANNYPMSFKSQWANQNNTVAIRPEDNGYSKDFTYYIRVLPNFKLYDLLDDKLYLFYFFVFSQTSNSSFNDIQVGEKTMGFANKTHNYYRHYLESPNGTYTFTVSPLSGNPSIFIAVSSSVMFPTKNNFTSYMYNVNSPFSKKSNVTQVVITKDDRMNNDYNCQSSTSGYYIGGGNTKCTFYIGIYCPTTCSYNFTVQIQNTSSSIVPKYLIQNSIYTGQVSYNSSVYFYLPVSTMTGEVTFFLNKSYVLGQENGDVSMSMIVINDTNAGYKTWKLPTWYYYMGYSSSGDATQPEIIELCGNTFAEYCQSNKSCAILLGVHNRNQKANTKFRLKVISDKTKLLSLDPVVGTIQNAGSYHYYYFTNNMTVMNKSAYWEYLTTVSPTNLGGDVDLFISALDSRNPSSLDYDFASQNKGPDDIIISANSSFFARNAYNVQNGMLFVVGVKAMTNNVSYSLMISGPKKFNFTYSEINMTSPITVTWQNYTKRGNQTTMAKTFKLFNYGGGDFQIAIDNFQGGVYAFLNYYSDLEYRYNIYQSIPINQNNSIWSMFVNTSESKNLRVYKDQAQSQGIFCYYCWYYITVLTNYTQETSFQLSVQRIADSGSSTPSLVINQQQTVNLANNGSSQQYKVIFDNKEPFTIIATVTTGVASMFVGRYPDAPYTKYKWTTSSRVGTMQINVKQTASEFNIGTWYYITVVSTGGGKAQVLLQVQQLKAVEVLQNRVIHKDLFWTEQEVVKFYVVQVPWGYYRMNVSVQSLTDDFYPMITMNKQTGNQAPSDLRLMNFSNFVNYTYKFGDNPTHLAYQSNFLYSIVDNSTTNFTYYLISVYSNSLGLTDRRKHQFQIQVSFQTGTKQSILKESIVNVPIVPETSSIKFDNDMWIVEDDQEVEEEIEDDVEEEEDEEMKEQTWKEWIKEKVNAIIQRKG